MFNEYYRYVLQLYFSGYVTESTSGVNNKHRYVVATQSHPLRVKLRSIPAAPIIHINRSVMVLEPPSDATLNAKHVVSVKYHRFPSILTVLSKNEERILHATLPELKSVSPSTSTQPPRKKKGPKGPNPLSVKKKKPKAHPQPTHRSSGDKFSAGSKRKLEQVVGGDGDGNDPTKKPKREKIDSDTMQ